MTIKIYCIAEPQINWRETFEWLDDLGVLPWGIKFRNTHPQTGDGLAEVAERRCYLSFGTDLIPNVVKIREDQVAYIANVLNSRHGSVTEHAQYTFALEGVGHILTHELVHHRTGTAVSQESDDTTDGLTNGLIWSANLRVLRHIIETRSAADAEVEIREFAGQLGQIMKKKAPLLFADFRVDEEGQWIPRTSKV